MICLTGIRNCVLKGWWLQRLNWVIGRVVGRRVIDLQKLRLLSPILLGPTV